MKLTHFLTLTLLCSLCSYGFAEQRVTIFSQVYCQACAATKTFFEKENIAYTETFIDKSLAAMAYFLRLGGRGTPLILVNNLPIHGFQKDAFWRVYREQAAQQGSVKPASVP